ncbi:SRPBCC domain-containing protein [Longimicrobium sp.]|uniref:SRPBCC family protein n=1 Tax=Longimicrobium sp. TaxID=2029185 RepID=UPI002E32B5FD|nr:SRPBCC domain-containing protein [Longimicrobium sp.]HEX6036644.1 SRPBCC domain-containing protein [Longimicrobium sp.]
MDTETAPAEGQHVPNLAEQKPYVIEVRIDAPADAVWRAVSDPAEIRRWFGWDTPSLDEEIQYIFIDHATQQPPQRLDFGELQTLDIVPDGSRTVVRLVVAGGLADARWEDLYDAIEEGWRTFFHQLRYYAERALGRPRRTLYLTGTARASAVLAALEAAAPGEPWQSSRHQRAFAPSAGNVGLISLLSPRPLDSDEPAKVSVTLTTYDLDDDAFAQVQREWTERWTALVPEGKVSA